MPAKKSDCWKAASKISGGVIDADRLKKMNEIAVEKFGKSKDPAITSQINEFIDTQIKEELKRVLRENKQKITDKPYEQGWRSIYRNAIATGKSFNSAFRSVAENVYNAITGMTLRETFNVERDIRRSGSYDYWLETQRHGITHQNQKNIAYELHELNKPNGKAGITNDVDALNIAKIFKNKFDELVAQKKALGVDVDSDDMIGYITRQIWIQDNVRKGGRGNKFDRETAKKEFINDAIKHADARTYKGLEGIMDVASPEELAKYWGTIYGHIESGYHLYDTDSPSLVSIQRKLQGKEAGDKRRVIHFKDADSFIYMMDKYGMGSLTNMLESELHSNVRQIELARTFGSNPSHFYENTIKKLAQEQRIEFGTTKWDSFKDAIASPDNVMKELDGSVNQSQSASLASWGAAIRTFQAITHLGFATPKSFGDMYSSAAQLEVNGAGLFQSLGGMIYDTGRYFILPDEHTHGLAGSKIAEGLLIEKTVQLSAIYRNAYLSPNKTGFLSKLASGYYIFNGLHNWTKSAHTAFQMRLANVLSHYSDKQFDALHAGMKQRLAASGITAKDWDVLRANVIKDEDGRGFITMESIDKANISSDEKNVLNSKFASYLIDQTQTAVPQPSVIENAIMRQGSQTGTLSGEFMRMAMQFKGFPLAMLTRGIGDRWESDDIKLNMIQTAKLIGGLTMAGTFIELMGQVATGGDPFTNIKENPTEAVGKLLQRGLFVGGGLSIVGDILLTDYTEYGRSMADILAGPSFSDFARGVSDIQKVATGKMTAKRAIQEVNAFAVPNILGFRHLLEYLVLNDLMDLVSGGEHLEQKQKLDEERTGNGARWLPYSAGLLR